MHVFYDIQKLKLADRKKVINDAFAVNDSWRVDELDCSKSWRRQQIEMSFEDIMKKFDKSCHFTIIHRKDITGDEYGEIGFCTKGDPNLFLWIYTSVADLETIIASYKLKVMV
jgi:hypothetical protein